MSASVWDELNSYDILKWNYFYKSNSGRRNTINSGAWYSSLNFKNKSWSVDLAGTASDREILYYSLVSYTVYRASTEYIETTEIFTAQSIAEPRTSKTVTQDDVPDYLSGSGVINSVYGAYF